ncbi:MAG TPA: phosphotransferase, partial [Thermodesulfobacteriota bacterium]|nr:phosphotransferase [Thermodesulfobacteriota bacterium]
MPNVTLLNKPELSLHDVDRKFNDRRTGLVPMIEEYVSKHDLFKGKDVSIYFIEKGAGSLVAKIETNDEKLILKVPLSLAFSKGEGLFLKTWENAGVKVPRVYEEGSFGELSYILMEYIDAPVITGRYSPEESLKKKIYVDLGKTLRTMHAPKAEGFGGVVDGKAEYSRFSDWINGPDMK